MTVTAGGGRAGAPSLLVSLDVETETDSPNQSLPRPISESVAVVLREFIQWELDQLPATRPEPFLSPLLNEYTERMTR